MMLDASKRRFTLILIFILKRLNKQEFILSLIEICPTDKTYLSELLVGFSDDVVPNEVLEVH